MIHTGLGLWTLHQLLGFFVTLNSGSVGITRVPEKSIDAGFFGEAWFLLPIGLCFFLCCKGTGRLLFLFGAGERLDLFSRSIKDGEGYVSLGLLFEIVSDDRSIEWVLSCIQVTGHFLSGGFLLLLVCQYEHSAELKVLTGPHRTTKSPGRGEALCCCWEDMRGAAAYLLAELTQRH